MVVYYLSHSILVEEPDIYDTNSIGFYSTKEKAEQVIEEYKKLPGFKDYPDCFEIEEMEVDFDDYEFV